MASKYRKDSPCVSTTAAVLSSLCIFCLWEFSATPPEVVAPVLHVTQGIGRRLLSKRRLLAEVTWTSATRTSTVTGVDGGDLVVSFTPSTAVPQNGTVTITPSANLFTADAATTCTATSDGNNVAVTSAATVGAILTVTMGAELGTSAAVITCTDNLAVNGAQGDEITFAIETSTDTTPLTGQTGYTVTAPPPTAAPTETPTAVPTQTPTPAPTGDGHDKPSTSLLFLFVCLYLSGCVFFGFSVSVSVRIVYLISVRVV